MGRFFIIVLLLVIFFLSGALYGMNQDSFVMDRKPEHSIVSENPSTIPAKVEEEENTELKEEGTATVETVDKDILAVNNKAQATNKAASFLETSVQGFYEVVVQILYEIANIFF